MKIDADKVMDVMAMTIGNLQKENAILQAQVEMLVNELDKKNSEAKKKEQEKVLDKSTQRKED